MATKVSLSLKLEPEVRKQLEEIANMEERTLSNQISVFLKRSIKQYAQANELIWHEENEQFVNLP